MTTDRMTAHHPACPGTLRHRLELGGDWEHGFDAFCTICGVLPEAKIHERPADAFRQMAGHEHDEPCPGCEPYAYEALLADVDA